MQRKWMFALATMISITALAAGISQADDDDSPLHKLMEQVNRKSNAIKKAIRTPVAFKKAQSAKEIAANADDLIKLSKETKEMAKDGVKKAKNVKDAEAKWGELSDAFTKQLEKFSETVSKAGVTQAAAKSAWGTVNQSCTDCHTVFRVEQDSF